MKYPSRPLLCLSLLAFSAFAFAASPPIAPQTDFMEPRVGKPGTVIKIKGKSLDKSHIDEVYLTDHRFDMKVKILEQSESQLTFRIPPFAKPGRLQLLILTAGNNPVYLEQPWFVQIESSDDESPVATPAPPVEVSKGKKSKPTVEVASNGSAVAVPLGGTPPAPATTPNVEKSVVPLKPQPPVESGVVPPPPAPAPAPRVTAEPKFEQPMIVKAPEPPPPPPAPVDSGTPAQVIQKTRVIYPSSAQSQRIEGTVELIALVGEDGRVKSVRVIKGNPFLASAAMASVREWIYEPAQLHGKPVRSDVVVVLNFKRPSN